MSTPRNRLILIGISLWFAALTVFSPFSLAEIQTFPVEKIQPGMKGIGYSVFSGTKVEPFDVQIISVVEDNFGKDQLILVKLSGDRIQESGGLAAGMSGSPVYLKRKLLGAISYGFENADSFLALVTPIQSMEKLWSGSSEALAAFRLPFRPVPAITPVFVTGMGTRGFELISKTVGGSGVKPVALPGPAVAIVSKRKVDPLRPGSAIAVQMVTGDYQVAAIGTVTTIDRDRFLAFGHSFTNKGEVDYLALQAYIAHTVKSPVMSFKIGIPIQPVGRVVQDRQAGIAGRLKETPKLIPVAVTATDADRKITRNTHFQVVNNEQVYRDLIVAGVTDAIDQTIDRVGSGSAKIRVKIETGTHSEPIVRENRFYGKDIAIDCTTDLRNLLEILSVNEYTRADIRSVQVEAEIREKQETARIVKLEAAKKKPKPGGRVPISVLLHTFRGESMRIPFEVELPENIQPGKLLLTVYGGSKDSTPEENTVAKKEVFKIDYKDADSLPKLIENYLNTPFNNQIVLEYQPALVDSKTGGDAEDNEKRDLQPIRLKAETPYYIFGEAQLTIEITSV